MSQFEIKPATRSAVKALVGFYGKSGGGKTMSALLFARGLVGPSGRIVGIDTENHRMSLFADLIPGGYSVLDLAEPFSPARYYEAIELAEASADVIVIDSMSHEHAGEGGILDMQEAELQRMAGDNWQKREACKMAAWIRPKMEHKRLVNRLLRSKCHVLCCLRGEEKTTIKKVNGKTEIQKDDFTTCIADPRFVFEMLVNLEVYEKNGNGGFAHIRKITHSGTRACLPSADEQVSIRHGEALAAWCAAPGSGPQKQAPASAGPTDEIKTLRAQLWESLKEVRGNEGTWRIAQQWLTDELAVDKRVQDLSAEELKSVIHKVDSKLCELTP